MPVEDRSPRNWSLWATHPAKLGCIAECYPTMTVADERAKSLRLAGYSVDVALVKPGIGG
jgi:hypothetical protein